MTLFDEFLLALSLDLRPDPELDLDRDLHLAKGWIRIRM
jgi:hypothetical protein